MFTSLDNKTVLDYLQNKENVSLIVNVIFKKAEWRKFATLLEMTSYRSEIPLCASIRAFMSIYITIHYDFLQKD